ncbi:outer membrane beta-barrel protein [Hymenobacter armeniacus]|nr:outer membrane beta-barrel protein [Hymenobacter armeniacus]
MLFRYSKSFFLALSLLATAGAVQAQQNFRPGYVVKTEGDTLRGQVQVRGAHRSEALCRFRPNSEAGTVDYKPAALRGYGLANGQRYETRLVPTTDSLGRPAQRQLFLEPLVSGRASLYTRRDAFDEVHYYLYLAQAGAGPVQELENRVVRRIYTANEAPEVIPVYRKTLSEAFRDCFAVQPSLPKLEYTASSLAAVVRRYNACSEPEAVFKSKDTGGPKRQGATVAFGVAGGVARTSMKFQGEISLRNGTFTSVSPLFGVYFTSTFPELNRNLELRVDALYQKLDYNDSYVARGFSSVDLREQASLQFQRLAVPLQLRYYFRTNTLRPYVYAGVNGNYLLSYATQLRSEYTAGGVPVVTNKEAVNPAIVSKTDFGVLGGAGLSLGVGKRAIGLELRAERNGGFVSSPTISAPIIQYGGGVSFQLF